MSAVPLQIAAPVRTGPNTYLGWQSYPVKVAGHSCFETALQSLSDQLSSLKDRLFSNEVDLNIIDITEFQGAVLVNLFAGVLHNDFH